MDDVDGVYDARRLTRTPPRWSSGIEARQVVPREDDDVRPPDRPRIDIPACWPAIQRFVDVDKNKVVTVRGVAKTVSTPRDGVAAPSRRGHALCAPPNLSWQSCHSDKAPFMPFADVCVRQFRTLGRSDDQQRLYDNDSGIQEAWNPAEMSMLVSRHTGSRPVGIEKISVVFM